MKKLLIIFGTRPEIIKLAPLIIELKKNKDIELITCSTGQHKELISQVTKIFKIKIDYDLNVMRKVSTLESITISILKKLPVILLKEKPKYVLVHGDTTTTFTSSLAAFYMKIPVIHLEAGLRTNTPYSPFPEEMNRMLVSKIADIHLAPTRSAYNNLIKEGINKERIFVTGNTVIDSIHAIKNKNRQNLYLKNKYKKFIDKKLILITVHRRENYDKNLDNICDAILSLSLRKDIKIIFSVHPNPNITNKVKDKFKNCKNIILTKPLNYFEFIYLMEKSYLILTDSGGIQEEAPTFSKPLIILRNITERNELIKIKGGVLVGSDSQKIVNKTNLLLDNIDEYKKLCVIKNPFGDGNSSKRIYKILLNLYKK